MSYKVLVGKPFTPFRDVYVAIVQFMHGDADAYTTEIIVVGGHQEDAVRFAELVDWLTQNRRRGSEADFRRQGPHYEEFFGDDEWHYDVTCDTQGAKFDTFSLYWYNSLGQKCLTDITDPDGDIIYQAVL